MLEFVLPFPLAHHIIHEYLHRISIFLVQLLGQPASEVNELSIDLLQHDKYHLDSNLIRCFQHTKLETMGLTAKYLFSYNIDTCNTEVYFEGSS